MKCKKKSVSSCLLFVISLSSFLSVSSLGAGADSLMSLGAHAVGIAFTSRNFFWNKQTGLPSVPNALSSELESKNSVTQDDQLAHGAESDNDLTDSLNIALYTDSLNTVLQAIATCKERQGAVENQVAAVKKYLSPADVPGFDESFALFMKGITDAWSVYSGGTRQLIDESEKSGVPVPDEEKETLLGTYNKVIEPVYETAMQYVMKKAQDPEQARAAFKLVCQAVQELLGAKTLLCKALYDEKHVIVSENDPKLIETAEQQVQKLQDELRSLQNKNDVKNNEPDSKKFPGRRFSAKNRNPAFVGLAVYAAIALGCKLLQKRLSVLKKPLVAPLVSTVGSWLVSEYIVGKIVKKATHNVA